MPSVMHPVGYQVPSIGVRFNDPQITSHLSMSSLGSTARSSQDQWDNYNRQQIYKKVNDWFTEWRPWQQRMLLCGLTNRCSTSQLESLATTLEPLFHRDFVTSLKKRYPSAPFRRQKARELEEKQNEKHDLQKFARRLVRELIENALLGDSGVSDEVDNALTVEEKDQEGVVGEDDEHTGEDSNKAVIDENDIPVEGDATKERHDEVSDGCAEVNENKETVSDESCKNAEETAEGTTEDNTTNDKGEVPQENTNTQENQLDEVEGALLEDNQTKESEVDVETLEANKSEEAVGVEGLAVNLEDIIEAEELEEDAEDDELLFVKTTPKFDGPRQIFISRPFLSVFEYAQQANPESVSASIKDNLGLLLTRQHFSLENQQQTCQSFPQSSPMSASNVRMHRHRSGIRTADVRITDFFERRMSRLGPLQAQLRTGSVRRPSHVGNIDAPVQKIYKHSKFWGSNPKEGKTFVRPKKSHLKWHFREQVKRVWEWIIDWEEWEKLNLLTNIVKRCDQDLLNYLTQCIIERLRERVDISWLSDPLLLLIFSYLPSSDIESASRVCRRWRYLTSTNELWMIKCQEFGMDQGISNILDLVKASGVRGQDIDWRLAYMELQAITEQARLSLPIPSRLEFEGPTPVGKRRIGGKFISAFEPAKLQRRYTARTQGSRHNSSKESSAGQDNLTVASYRGRGAAKPPDEITKNRAVEDGLASVHEKPASSHEADMSFPSRGVSRFQSVPSPLKSERPVMSRDGPRESKTSARRAKSRKDKLPVTEENLQGPLRQYRGKKKTDDDDDEPARDVRPELVQAKDVLRKSAVTSKMWSAEDAKEARERLETYVGKVTPVKRVRKLQGHMDAVLSLEMDARRLVSGSMDRAIRIWDIRSGRSLHKFYGHKGGVTCLKFSNETLYSGSWDTTVMVWDLVKFERIDVLTGHKGSVSCLAMNDDFLFSGSHDGTVRMWQRSTLLCNKTLDHHTSHVLCMALSGPHIITGSSDKTVQITDFLNGVGIRTLKTSNPVDTLWLTGCLILTGDVEGHLYIWNKDTGQAEVGIKAHEAPITRVVYHSNHVYTASSDATIKEWDLMTMACVRLLQGHKGPVRDFKVSSKCMVSAGADGHVRLWDKVLPMFAMGEEQNTGLELVDQRNK